MTAEGGGGDTNNWYITQPGGVEERVNFGKPTQIDMWRNPTKYAMTTGQPVSIQIPATRNPTSWNASGLPSGLSINNSGIISGTSSYIGDFNATVTAINSDGNDSKIVLFRSSRGQRIIDWNQTFAGITYGDQSITLNGTATGSDLNTTNLPGAISGLKLWLDASDTSSITKNSSNKVSQWNDKSGNNRHVTQSGADSIKPTLSSDSIAFNGSQYLFNNTPFMYNNGSIEIYIVASGNTQNDKRLINEGSSSNNNPLYAFQITNQSPQNRLAVYFRNDANTAMRSQSAIVNDVAMDGFYKILNWKDTGSSIIASVNGGTTGSLSYSRSGSMTTNLFCIGGILRSSFVNGFSGSIKEIIISSPMSNVDSQKIEGYLANKWGLKANLPADHPYKNNAP
jgi:hypothetical protein